MAMIDVSSYKLKLLQDIFNNEEIVSAIDCKAQGFYPDEPDTIVYRALFPYLRIPETQTIASTYVLMSVDIMNPNRSNPTFCDIRITLWAMTHQSLMQIKGKNATRIDYISELLRNMLDGSKEYGHGVLELTSSREIILNENYQYRELVFRNVIILASSYNKVGSFK